MRFFDHLFIAVRQFVVSCSRVPVFTRVLIGVLLVVCVLLSSHLWHGDLFFHTDVARDFLVLDEMIQTQKLTLIGPRSGGISGVFHGPLWYYISLVPFLLTRGDPVAIGWFWWGCALLATATFFFFSWRASRHAVSSLLATICFTLVVTPGASHAINTFFAELFGFAIFFCWWRWTQKPSWLLAAAGWFGLGLLVQFQMAWAVPIAVVWAPFFLYYSARTKNWSQLLAPLFFLPPLASFVLFDLRHDWLQVRAVLAHLQESTSSLSLEQRFLARLFSATRHGLNVFALPGFLSAILVTLIGAIGWRTQEQKVRSMLVLFLLWYVLWWLSTLLFSGTVLGYYFSPFGGIILLCAGMVAAHSKFARVLLALGSVLLLFAMKSSLFYDVGRFDSSSWRLLRTIAADSLSTPDRGYFLYSQDQFAYSLKYAFLWQGRRTPESSGYYFVKKPNTVIVKSPDDPNNPFLTSDIWLKQRINIQQKPDTVQEYPFGYRVEQYSLDEAAQKVPIDQNLILDLHFR